MGVAISASIALAVLIATVYIFVTDEVASSGDTMGRSSALGFGLVVGGLLGGLVLAIGIGLTMVLSAFLAPAPVYARSADVIALETEKTSYNLFLEDDQGQTYHLGVSKSNLQLESTDAETPVLDIYEAWNPFTYAMAKDYVLHVPKGTMLNAEDTEDA